MTTYYVKSTATGTADGLSWANAFLTLAAAAAVDAAGDTIYVSQAHNETSAAAVTLSFAGTDASPVRVICANDAAEPPTAVATGAVVATTGANAIRVYGNVYMEGIRLKAGNGNNVISLYLNNLAGNYRQHYVNCELYLGDTNTGGAISVGLTDELHETTFTNCTFRLSTVGQKITLNNKVVIKGGGVTSGTPAITPFFSTATGGSTVDALVEGFDFSVLSTSFGIVAAPSRSGSYVIRGCTMPASWSGNLISGAITNAAIRIALYDCDNTTADWLHWVEDYSGQIKAETVLVRTGSLAPYSLKMATNAKANEAFGPLKSNEIFLAVGTPGSAQTATFEILHDSVTNLTDGEIWVEVEYRDTSGSRRSVEITDHRATLLTTAADQTTSSATWTTTGLTNPNKQKLAVTFTPQVAGYSVARIVLAKPSKTVYVDTDSGVV